MDRISFTLIYQRRSPGDDVQKKVWWRWHMEIQHYMWTVGWGICASPDQSERTKKWRWWWWRGGEQCCGYLWGMWSWRPEAPASGVHTLWFRVWFHMFWFVVIPPCDAFWIAPLMFCMCPSWCSYVQNYIFFLSSYHMHCLRPTLNTRPEGDWVCPECAVTAHVTGKSV